MILNEVTMATLPCLDGTRWWLEARFDLVA
jgi:hypothetical protein